MKKGFTLVELIIVVAIISLLSSIVIPKFGDAYGQINIWITEEESLGGTFQESFGDIILGKGGTWFTNNYLDSFSLETTLSIHGSGRMEVFLGMDLEGFSEGEDGFGGHMLRIHPVKKEEWRLEALQPQIDNKYAVG